MTNDNGNFAEREARVFNNPTDEDAYRMGNTHKAYGWARTPVGSWEESKKQAYYKGFDGKPMASDK